MQIEDHSQSSGQRKRENSESVEPAANSSLVESSAKTRKQNERIGAKRDRDDIEEAQDEPRPHIYRRIEDEQDEEVPQ